MRCYEGCNTASYTCHVNQSVSQINVLRWTIVIIGESVILDATHFSTTYIMRGLNHHQSLIINHQWTNNQSTVTQHPYYISIILSTNNNNIALTCASPTLLVIAYVWSRITLSLWQLRISFLSTLAKSSYTFAFMWLNLLMKACLIQSAIAWYDSSEGQVEVGVIRCVIVIHVCA